MATDPGKSTLENLVTEGVKLASSQQAVNGIGIATFAKTFFDLDDKQAAAIGVGYALLSEHLNSTKELSDGSTETK